MEHRLACKWAIQSMAHELAYNMVDIEFVSKCQKLL